MGPAGHGTPQAEFQISGGWDSVSTVVDVGGGTGAMLAELLQAQPSLRGILVDLPRTVARSGEVFRAAGIAERVVAVGQSFFDPLPRGADLYLLRGVPNDFPDREATAVLGRCAEAVSPDGRIIIRKSVGADDAWKRLTSSWCCLAAGTGNSPSVCRVALSAEQQPSGYFVIECRPS
jgi:hypothetical protein